MENAAWHVAVTVNNNNKAMKKNDPTIETQTNPCHERGAAENAQNTTVYKTPPLFVTALLLLLVAVGVQGYFLTKIYHETADQRKSEPSLTLPEKRLPDALADSGEQAAKADGVAEDKAGSDDRSSRGTAADLFADDWDPFGQMSALRQRMNRIFGDDFFSRSQAPNLPAPDNGWAFNGGGTEGMTIGSHVRETDRAVIVTFDLPDVDEDSINISVEDGVLQVSARQEKVKERLDDHDQVVGRSRSVNSFSKTITIPADVNTAAMSHEVIDGELKITLPKIY